MKKLIYMLFPVMLVLSGCSSRTLKPEIKNVGLEQRRPEKPTSPRLSPKDMINGAAFHHYTNGLLLFGIGDMAAAAESFKRALQTYPRSYEIRYALAEAMFRQQRFREVLMVLDIIDPVDLAVLKMQGACFRSLGEADLARETYLRIIGKDPDNSMAYSYLAGAYRRLKNVDSVAWAYENMVRIRPGNYRTWHELAKIRALQQKYEGAAEAFCRSIEINPEATNIMSYVGLAEMDQLTDQFDSATVVMTRGLQQEPSNAVLTRMLAIHFLRLDSLSRALPFALRFSEISPESRDAKRRVGAIYFGLDSLDKAYSYFSMLVAGGEHNSVNHYYLGRIASLKEDYPKAVEEYTLLTKLADSLYDGWLDLGWAYKQMGNADNEIETYRKGLAHVQDQAGQLRLLFALGAAYEQQGQIEQSISTFEEVIARDPDFAPALNYLGYLLADSGQRLDYAHDLVKRAVELSPDNAAYLDSYGWIFYHQEKYGEALTYLKRAAELANDPTILDHLGDTYKATGNLDDAILWWRKALELAPDNDDIREKLND